MMHLVVSTVLGLASLCLLRGYLKFVQGEYYGGQEPSSLLNTCFYLGWYIRPILILIGLLWLYPAVLSSGGWSQLSLFNGLPFVAFLLLYVVFLSGRVLEHNLGRKVSLDQQFMYVLCGMFGSCFLLHNWWVPLMVLIGVTGCVELSHVRKGFEYNGERSPLYFEKVVMYSLGITLTALPLINYFC